MKYKAVIFDLFGTLVDIFLRRAYERALVEMASILGTTYDEFTKIWHQTSHARSLGIFGTLERNIEHVCHELKVTSSEKQVKLACQVRFNLVKHAMSPKNEALEVLEQLKSAGYLTGLISNCSTEIPAIWPNTPFAPLFDVTVFSCEVSIKKPDLRIYRIATDRLGIKPEECLYIGDGDGYELNGATEAGMHPVLIRNPHEDSNEVMRIDYQGEDWEGPVITSLREVLNLLK